MANASFDDLWNEAMGELDAQLHVEGVDGDEGGDAKGTQAPLREVTILEAFQHFACLYIKYVQIMRKLEQCYDCMLHPQKRIEVKKVLELVIRRVMELKMDLVKWNPPNSYLKMPTGPEVAMPWEYVHLDELLVDLKLSPETLEIPVPKYFKEDIARQLEQRDRLVSGYMRLKHNTDAIYIEDEFDVSQASQGMTVDRAIEIIQRHERGRQGWERASMVRDLREKEKQNRMYDASAQLDMDPDIAATNIQRMLKGFASRREARRERENELMFVGMQSRKDNLDALEREMEIAYRKRKQDQLENKELYEKALDDLKDVIYQEEGPEKKEELREERTLWITDQIAQDKLPEDLEGFYKTKKPGDEPDDEAGGKDAKGKGGKDAKGKDAKGKGDKKDKGKDAKGKGKKGGKGGDDDEDANAMPKLQGKTELTEALAGLVGGYEETWEGRDESDNFQQRHDVDLGKQVVRPGVYEDLRKQVDDMLVLNLKKIKQQLSGGGGKGKKGKKGKKKKGKKGKKGKKDKKKKPLPGEKIAELKGLDADHMLSLLIDQKLVVKCRNRPMSSLLGEFNYMGSMHHNADRKDEGAWEPPDPSIAQLRQTLTEYCVLPNGSAEVKAATEKNMIKTLMLYGPSGSGKTHAVEAIAHELGALLIHLNPEKLRGSFPGKTGPTKLVHMVMTVARDPTMQPAIIYIDECEKFFTGGKKNKDKEGPSRFKKDFLTYKNQALGPEHRVMVIGTSRLPEDGDIKDMRGFFDRFLYMPYPDYASRCMVWRHYLEEKIRDGILKTEAMNAAAAITKGDAPAPALSVDAVTARVRILIKTLDISTLAYISEGYAAGAIARTIRSVITPRRITLVTRRPLANVDLLDNLSLQEVTFNDDKKAFLDFTRVIAGLDDRRKKIEAMVAGEEEGGGKDKGKGGKK